MKFNVTISSRRPKDGPSLKFTVEAESAKHADVMTRRMMQVGQVSVEESTTRRRVSSDD